MVDMEDVHGSSTYELLMHALLWSGRGLHAQLTSRLLNCTAAQAAVGVTTEEHEKVLDDVQQNSKYALLATVRQLQQLHHCTHATQTSSTLNTTPTSQDCSAVLDTLTADDFCSQQGYHAWVYQSWECVQQQLWQLQPLSAHSGELQLHIVSADLYTPELQPKGCFSCLCSSASETQVYSPYCVAWLKDNASAVWHNSTTKDLSWPLGLLACTVPNKSNVTAPNAAAATGTQIQRTAVSEGCNQPQWQGTLQYHVWSHDAVLRLQVRSSASTGATLDWLSSSLAGSGMLAQGTSTHSRIANISDFIVGQVSLPVSSLSTAICKLQKQQSKQDGTCSSGEECAPASDPAQLQVCITVPLFGSAPRSSARDLHTARLPIAHSLKRKSRNSARRTVDPGAEQQSMMPDFMSDALQQQGQQPIGTGVGSTILPCSGTVSKGKNPLPAVNRPPEQLVVYDPWTGSCSGAQGRTKVGELKLLASYTVEQQLQPDSSAAIAAVSVDSIKALLEAASGQGALVRLPQPLCKAAATAASTASIFQSHEAIHQSVASQGGRAAAELEAAEQLVAAVWNLWQCGALTDAAAAYQPALIGGMGGKSSAMPGAQSGGLSTAAAALARGSKAPLWTRLTADGWPCSSEGSSSDWTLPAVRQLASHGSRESTQNCLPRDSNASMSSYVDSMTGTGAEVAFDRSADGRRCTFLLQGRAAASSVSTTSSRCSYSNMPEDSEGSRVLPGLTSQQPLLKLQCSDPVAAAGACIDKLQHLQHPSWSHVVQVQQQCLEQRMSRQVDQPYMMTAEACLQQLGLQSLVHSVTAMQAEQSRTADGVHQMGVLPSGYYLQLLSDAALIGGLRPAAIRLAMLKRLLQCWQPGKEHLRVLLELLDPLMLSDKEQLLTKTESAALEESSGKLMNKIQQVLSCHHDLYTTQAEAAACLPLLLALLAPLAACTTLQQLAATATPLLAAAAQLRFLTVLNSDAPADTAATVANIEAQLAAAPPPSAQVPDVLVADNGSTAASELFSGIANAQANEDVRLTACPGSAAERPALPGIFDLLRFRDSGPRLSDGTPSRPLAGAQVTLATSKLGNVGYPTDLNSVTGSMTKCQPVSSSGLISVFLEMVHQPRGSSASGGVESEDAGWQNPDTIQQAWQPVQEGEAHAVGNIVLPFWRRAQQQQTASQLYLVTPGPVAEGIMRSDSDDALEAACRAQEEAHSKQTGMLLATTKTDVLSAAPAAAAAAKISAGFGSLLGGKPNKLGSQPGKSATETPTQQLTTGTSQSMRVDGRFSKDSIGQSTVAVISATSMPADDTAHLQAKIAIRTKLVYESDDCSSNGRSSNTLTSNRRSTVQNVGYFGAGAATSVPVTPQPAVDSVKEWYTSGSAGPTQANKPRTGNRHVQTGSLGTLEGVLSRFGKQQRSGLAAVSGTPLSTSEQAATPGVSLPVSVQAAAITERVSGGHLVSVTSIAATGSELKRRFSTRHSGSGSQGSLQLRESNKEAHEQQQQQQPQAPAVTRYAVSSSGSPAVVHQQTRQATASGAALAALPAASRSVHVGSHREVKACSRMTNAHWERDAMNLAAALEVLREELVKEMEMQVHLPPQLQLPLIGLHVRYSLIQTRLKALLACGHELPYDTTVRQLEAGFRKLHADLMDQGWAVMEPAYDNGAAAVSKHAVTAALPERDAAGDLPPVRLCDLDSLMAPIWQAWLRSAAMRLMSLVDGLVAAQSDAPAAAAGPTGTCNHRAGCYSSTTTCWVPVAVDQGALYSSSVVDLFLHLQGVTDQVTELAVKPVRSLSRRAANVRLLTGMVAAGIQRYTAHLHSAAARLLRLPLVVVAPNAAVQSGKTTRHRRGASVGSTAGSRQISLSGPVGNHGRIQSSLLKQGPSTLTGPTGASGGSGSCTRGSHTGSSSDTAGGAGLQSSSRSGWLATAGAPCSDSASASAALDSFTAAGMPLAYSSQAVLTPEVCVVLSSLQEVLHQQQQLDQRIWEELMAGTPIHDADIGKMDSGGPCGDTAAYGPSVNCNDAPDCMHIITSRSCRDSLSSSNSDSDVSEVMLTDDAESNCAECSHNAVAAAPAAASGQESKQCLTNAPGTGMLQAAPAYVPRQDKTQKHSNCTVAPLLQSQAHLVHEVLADIQQGSRHLSETISALIAELIQVVIEQLQVHHISLLAALLCMHGLAEETAACTVGTSSSAGGQHGVQAAAAAAVELLAHDAGVQLLLGPLIAELEALHRHCSPEMALQLLRAQWKALLGAVVKLALGQAHGIVASKRMNLQVSSPLKTQQVILLQQLLVVLQAEICQVMTAQASGRPVAAADMCQDTSACSSRIDVLTAAAGVADAACRARAVLKLLLLPTPQVIQQFLDMQASPRQQLSEIGTTGAVSCSGTQEHLSQLDVLRCLRQRSSDPEAQLFLSMQLHKAGGGLMRLLFGLPAEEIVQVYAACVACDGKAAAMGSKLGKFTGTLGGLRGTLSSHSNTPGRAAGFLYLSPNYLAFTDLIADSHTAEDNEAFAKRIANIAHQQGSRPASKHLQQMYSAAGPPATAGSTGSSGNDSTGLATKPWWKSPLLASGGSSNNVCGGNGIGAAAARSANAVPADTTALIPLASVARLDKVYHKEKDALALTMLDRSSWLFHGFESAAVRDKLHDAVRLAVMGSNTVLDCNLRCFRETVAALDLALPDTEKVLRVHQCLKYGAVRNKPGNLYLCSTLLAFDYDDNETPKAAQGLESSTGNAIGSETAHESPAAAGDTGIPTKNCTGSSSAADAINATSGGMLLTVGSRIVVQYQDILHLKQEQGSWGDKYWLVIMFTGPKGECLRLELGGGSQALATDIMADLSRNMAAAGH